MLEDIKKVIYHNLLIERTYRMSKREVTIDNIKSLILSNNIVEKKSKTRSVFVAGYEKMRRMYFL